MSEKTVFISYRRDAAGRFFARSLKQELTHRGYDVFLDVDCVDAGQWAAQIITQVPKRAHFLVLLTPGALDRCVNNDDWVRREFLAAVQHRRNIVPVREESVDLSALSASCHESVKAIFTYQSAVIRHQSFEQDLETLVAQYISHHKAPPLAGPPKPPRLGEVKADLSRILKYAPGELIGRDDELKLLNNAWFGRAGLPPGPDPSLCEREDFSEKVATIVGVEEGMGTDAQQRVLTKTNVLTFVALGGEGKTSLVAKWAVDEMLAQCWPGCDAAFAWSFYSQGTREQLAASSDLFLKEALAFFATGTDEEVKEIKAFAASPSGAFEKGQRLARLVGQRRSLLILDGLEPLQYAPTAPTPGQLKDQGIAALLKGLAQNSQGLCIVTTRYSLPDLRVFWQTAAPEVKLLRMSRDAGVHLLKTLGVTGTAQEFAALVEDVKGHALTLTLLGGFLKRAFHGDIRQRDRVKFEKADEKMDGGHAFRTMAAYEQWLLRDGGVEGRREVAVLRLMGLFDGPADVSTLAALRSDSIRGLTEPLAGLANEEWEFCLSGLEAAKLLTVNRDASGALLSIDDHPLLRAYFAKQLRTKRRVAWNAGHRQIYKHLCATTPDKPQPTLEDLRPLYQAVTHGCQAGFQRETFWNVYRNRINRGQEFYGTNKLGAFGFELIAITCFFDAPWKRPSPVFEETVKAWLLNEAASDLRALGRLTEALDPMRAGLEMCVHAKDWKEAVSCACNLSHLELTLGEIREALNHAEQAVTYEGRRDEPFHRIYAEVIYAHVLHQADLRTQAETHYREAERIQAEFGDACPLLYSVQGFQFCDLLLTVPERVAWQTIIGRIRGEQFQFLRSESQPLPSSSPTVTESCRASARRAAQILNWEEGLHDAPILDFALHHLTLGRAALFEAIQGNMEHGIRSAEWESVRCELDTAVLGLRRAGQQNFLPLGLLTRAWLRFLTGALTGPESAQADLDEAWEIAARGPMKLFLADIHLHRARLFGLAIADCRLPIEGAKYPWQSPAADLAAAAKLINACGYHRRNVELADAQRALLPRP